MSDWYDKAGRPLVTAKSGTKKWIKEMGEVEKLLADPSYKIIKQQKTWYGALVSTVWLGLDQDFSWILEGEKINPNPIIFETMVFMPGWLYGGWGFSGMETRRYSSEWEAKLGHEALFSDWNSFRGLIDTLKAKYDNNTF